MNFVIGVDGGGTKTEAAAMSMDGAEVGRFAGKASNPYAVTFEKAIDHIHEVLMAFFNQAPYPVGQCAGVCLGLSGVDKEQEKQRFHDALLQFVRQLGADFPIWIRNDAEIALNAALGTHFGIAVISGTGSIVYGITPEGGKFRTGGWGHLLSDEGSGYQIGLRTLQAVMRQYDGVIPETSFSGLVLNKLQISSPLDLKEFVYQPEVKKQHIAEFAELCIRAASEQDAAAVEILRRSAAELAELTIALRKKHDYFQSAPIAAIGSVFKHSTLFLEAFKQELAAEKACNGIIVSGRSSAYGAASLAVTLSRAERFNA